MAIYSTFFVLSASALASAFPGWKPPLPNPVIRVVTTFAGTRTIETREPEWDAAANLKAEATPALEGYAIQGDYRQYLESRLPEIVRHSPHWCSKGLTPVELDPLGKFVDGKPTLTEALYSPPSESTMIFEFRPEILSAVAASPVEFAKKWAAEMSKPEYTHSASGARLNSGWKTEEALEIIRRLSALAPKIDRGSNLYLIVEP